MIINLNETVYFEITKAGLEVLAAEDARLGMKPGLMASVWRHDSKTNQCTAQLWEVMHVFGPTMTMGQHVALMKDNNLEVKDRS